MKVTTTTLTKFIFIFHLVAVQPLEAFILSQGWTVISKSLVATGKETFLNELTLSAIPRRYGPPPEGHDGRTNSDANFEQSPTEVDSYRHSLLRIIQEVSNTKDSQHIPSVLTRHVDFLARLVQGGILGKLVVDVRKTAAKDLLDEEQLDRSIELILEFVEGFVDEASKVDQQNKQLLGKIVKTLANKDLSSREREQKLDSTIKTERLTAGFLRHLESECRRIEKASSMTPESVKMLQILRMIQVRVLEEFGRDLGEAAQVLGQLIAYETKEERIAVLEAGLTVQGTDFAIQMRSHTQEALDGFRRVPGGADPDLVGRVEEIDDRLSQYLDNHSSFQ